MLKRLISTALTIILFINLLLFATLIVNPQKINATVNEIALLPTSDIEINGMKGIRDSNNLYRNVDDDTSFASTDDNTSYVNQLKSSPTSSHTVGYFDPSIVSGTVTDVTVYYRLAGDISNTAKVQLYDGDRLLGTGNLNNLNSSWTNFSDTFTGLSVASAGNLRTKLILEKNSGRVLPRYTQIWIKATISTPTPESTPEPTPTPTPTLEPTPTPTPEPTPTPTPTPEAEPDSLSGLSEIDEQTLTTNLETLSISWDQPSVNSANDILTKIEYNVDDWEAYFEEYFNTTNHPFTNGLNNYIGYPTFYWFDDAVHQKLQTSLSKALWNKINLHTSAHAESLGTSMQNDQDLRQTLFNSHRFMAVMGRDGIAEAVRSDIYVNYKTHINDYPDLFKATNIINTESQPLVATLRAQIWMSFQDAMPLDDTRKQEIATTLNLEGKYLDLWNSFSTLIHDNNGFDTKQLDTIYNLINSVPRPILNLGNISQNELIGNIEPNNESFSNKSGVNIFNISVGGESDNQFPSDIDPVYSDGFTIVLAHEVTHIVDGYYINLNPALKSRRDTLIAQAGLDDLQYLRSMVGGEYFQQNPQEFVASIANEWFADSAHTLTLALLRFDQGYKEPLNQFLFFMDVMSAGGSKSTVYKIDSGGNIRSGTISVSRDEDQRIVSFILKRTTYTFTLDTDGNVTNYTKN